MSAAPGTDHLALAAGARHTRDEWEQAAATVLRRSGRLGDDDPDGRVWEVLARTTLDGIRITPLGVPAAVAADPDRPSRPGEWDVRVPVDLPDPLAANRQLLEELETGATSLWLQVGAAGLPADGIAAALEGVLLDAAPVVLDAPADPLGAARALVALRPGQGFAAGTNLGVDPVGAAVRGGPTDDPAATVAEAVGLATEAGVRALVVDGTAVHDLGASDAQELGYVLAVAACYLRALEDAGTPVEVAAASIELRLAVTDEQFPSIAKLRAARRLWARMLELSGVPTGPTTGAGSTARIHAVTSRPMMSRYDPWVNMLRTCVAAFAAGVGGADAVTVLPFDTRLGLPDAFGRRIARNTSALLISESHLARVADPAGGAWAVEELTGDLAGTAWAELGRIEEAGGVLAALEDGSLRARIDAVAAERDRQVATRQRPLTGVSEFPHLHEVPPARQPRPAGSPEVRSYGHAFEALRDEPATGRVFLATMGTVAEHTARATFTGNLLAAGGVEVVNPGPHPDTAALLSSYTGPDGGQPVVCLAGTDAAYAAWGAELVAALREAGAHWVVLAGRPGERTVPADLIDDSCAAGVDALAFLHRTREKLEMSHDTARSAPDSEGTPKS
ncbi:MAG TPA: methylmalonyl-CoA mutase family protein [Marmoricola sp.]|nr:methylmalonyl-CoA mutase family protein [Marmoricola sp.]